MSFIFRILPESVADAALEIAMLLAAVALLALLIESLTKSKRRRSG